MASMLRQIMGVRQRSQFEVEGEEDSIREKKRMELRLCDLSVEELEIVLNTAIENDKVGVVRVALDTGGAKLFKAAITVHTLAKVVSHGSRSMLSLLLQFEPGADHKTVTAIEAKSEVPLFEAITREIVAMDLTAITDDQIWCLNELVDAGMKLVGTPTINHPLFADMPMNMWQWAIKHKLVPPPHEVCYRMPAHVDHEDIKARTRAAIAGVDSDQGDLKAIVAAGDLYSLIVWNIDHGAIPVRLNDGQNLFELCCKPAMAGIRNFIINHMVASPAILNKPIAAAQNATILWLVCQSKDAIEARALLMADADVNLIPTHPDLHGDSCLHVAVRNGCDSRMITLLLTYGAIASNKNADGHTPADLAVIIGSMGRASRSTDEKVRLLAGEQLASRGSLLDCTVCPLTTSASLYHIEQELKNDRINYAILRGALESIRSSSMHQIRLACKN